jgi:hypothetical protein
MDEEILRVLYLALGFLAGAFGSIITDRNRRALDRKEFWTALIHELRELRLRMALVALHVHMGHASLDNEFLKWLGGICGGHKGASDVQAINALIEKLPTCTDEQIKHMVGAFNSMKHADMRSSYKHYYAPVLAGKIAQLGSLPGPIQIVLLEIHAQLVLFNEEVDRTMKFFDMTFQKLAEGNHQIAVANYDQGSKNIGRSAKVIADRISEIPELSKAEKEKR